MLKIKPTPMILGLLSIALICGCEREAQKFTSANIKVTQDVTFGSAPLPESSRQQSYTQQPLRVRPVPNAPSARERKVKIAGRPIRALKDYEGGTAEPTRGGAVQPGQMLSGVRQQSGTNSVNPMTRVLDDALSTFSIDVDTGSYTLARRTINSGAMPQANAVRVEEFVNYFRYDYPALGPEQGAFRVSLEAAPSPFEPGENRKIVRVGVQGKQLDQASRKPVHLTFLVDVSGSMAGEDRIELAKDALQVLTRNLGEEDTIAITTYAGQVTTILEPTGTQKRDTISKAINSLRTGGATRMGDGLQLAYETALKSFVAGDVNRVIVLSDGDANVGARSHGEILESIRSYVEDGVTLSTIGFGMGNYQDQMMEQLANKGNGNYYYIDSPEEARKVFGEQLDGTLQVIAKDVKIQVEFDADAVESYRLIGYENRDIADADFRRDRVDAGEIGAGHSVTALYEIVLSDAAARAGANAHLATVRIRAKKPTGTQAAEQEFALTTRELHASLADASADFQFATAVAGFAEHLRKSPYAQHISLALIAELARAATRSEQPDRLEFLALVAQVQKRSRHGLAANERLNRAR